MEKFGSVGPDKQSMTFSFEWPYCYGTHAPTMLFTVTCMCIIINAHILYMYNYAYIKSYNIIIMSCMHTCMHKHASYP